MIRHAEAGVGHLARTGRAIYDATGHTTQSRAQSRSRPVKVTAQIVAPRAVGGRMQDARRVRF